MTTTGIRRQDTAASARRSDRTFPSNSFATLVTLSARFARSEPSPEPLPDGRKESGSPWRDLNDGHVAAFVARLPRRRKTHVEVRTCGRAAFLGLFTREAGLQCPASKERRLSAGRPSSTVREYLRKDRGLAENSVHVYVPLIRDFLASQLARTGCIPAII